MTQKITIHELPPMLNGENGLKRMHWTKYRDVRDKWIWLVREQNPRRHKGKVVVKYTRVSTAMPDPDNVAASAKVVLDAFEKIGVLKNDSFEIITKFNVQWEKSKTIKGQKTVIEIEDVTA